MDDDMSPPPEATITLTPEVAARAGIMVEEVKDETSPQAGAGILTMPGLVQSNMHLTKPVVSLVGGVLRSVIVERGQSVTRGQTLAVVISNDLALTEQHYLATAAEREKQQVHCRRTTRLVQSGAADSEELERANAKLKSLKSEVAAERQRLLFLGRTPQRVDSLHSPSQVSAELELTAPVSGIVVDRPVIQGGVIKANTELFRVADIPSIWVIGQLYEKDLAGIRAGRRVGVTCQKYGARVFQGRVTYVDPSLNPTTHAAQVRIEIRNPDEALKIGMFVNVTFADAGGSGANVPVVSSAAVQNINNRQIVFVATDDPVVFAMRSVRLGEQAAGRYPVLQGLLAGDHVITQGSFMLRAEWLKSNPGGAAVGDHQH
jgi:cobalt-zinc-cadmium efflux system membrane fusion protein